MFDIFKGGKVQLDVRLDKQVYAPGDTIYAHISLQNDKELKIQGGRFALTCQQKYQYKRKHRDSDGHSKVDTTWGTNDLQVFRFDFLPETTLAPGVQTFETSFALDASAVPSSKGDIISVAWFAKATLDRKMAADTNSEVEFGVISANPLDSAGEIPREFGVANEPEEARMAFNLKACQATRGQTLAGFLRIFPQKNFGVNEVRLELLRDEYVADVSSSGYDHSKQSKAAEVKLAGKTQLQTGQYMDIPFSLALPADLAPSFQIDAGYLKYRLQGVLARTLRKDTLVEEEIVVYPA